MNSYLRIKKIQIRTWQFSNDSEAIIHISLTIVTALKVIVAGKICTLQSNWKICTLQRNSLLYNVKYLPWCKEHDKLWFFINCILKCVLCQ